MTSILSFLGLSKLRAILFGAGLSAILALVVGAYIKGRSDCFNASYVAKLEQELKLLRKSRDLQEKDSQSAASDRESDAVLEKKAKEIEDKISDGQCLTESDAGWLQRLWGTP